MSDPVRPHRWQPTRLPRPRDSPGKNTGVGCHFLLQCMKVKSESEVAQSCLTRSDPMDRSPAGSPVPGILQARALEWVHCLLQEICVDAADSLCVQQKLTQHHKATIYPLVTQSCLTLCNSMDCSLPVPSAHGILQARILERVAIPFSKISSQPRDKTQVSCIVGRLFIVRSTTILQ